MTVPRCLSQKYQLITEKNIFETIFMQLEKKHAITEEGGTFEVMNISVSSLKLFKIVIQTQEIQWPSKALSLKVWRSLV